VVSPLDRGFSGLYNLDFAGAQKDFAAWQAGRDRRLANHAEHGHYLAPFAGILMSIAYIREKDKPRACSC
jgi:hypothetical protein